MPAAATANTTMPMTLGRGSRWPRRENPEVTTMKAASKKSKAPAKRAASFSALAESDCVRNRQRTLTAEARSMALSPAKPKSAGLWAVQAARSVTSASMAIHTTVKICRRAARRSRSGAAVAAIVRAKFYYAERQTSGGYWAHELDKNQKPEVRDWRAEKKARHRNAWALCFVQALTMRH